MVEDTTKNVVPYALVSVWSAPDAELLEKSYGCLWACSYSGESDLRIIPICSITSVVSMQPLLKCSETEVDRSFVVEKSGIDNTELTGYIDNIYQNEQGNDDS